MTTIEDLEGQHDRPMMPAVDDLALIERRLVEVSASLHGATGGMALCTP